MSAPDHTCAVRNVTPRYVIDLAFPVDYPDQRALADYLIAVRDDFVAAAESPPEHDWPYSLGATSTSHHSGDQTKGTTSVVLTFSQDANPHPVTWFKAFNYDNGGQVPIALDSLLAPGARPLDVIYPAVRQELEKRWAPEVLTSMLGEVDDATFGNFAITDAGVTFYFGQGQLLGHAEGPLEVSVPRSELAAASH